MAATDLRFTELFAVKFAVAATGALAQSWHRGQAREHRRQQLAGEPVVIDARMLLLGCAALGLAVLDLLLIGRWIATGRGPGLRALVHSV